MSTIILGLALLPAAAGVYAFSKGQWGWVALSAFIVACAFFGAVRVS